AVHDGRRPGVGAATAERECRHQPGCRDAAAQPRRSHRVTSLVTPAARRPRPSYGSAGGSAEVVVGRAAALAEEVAGAAPATGVGAVDLDAVTVDLLLGDRAGGEDLRPGSRGC